jgi:MFS family permease
VSQGATLYLFGLLIVPMQEELGWTRVSLSGAFSVASLILGLAGLPIGRFVDSRGSRMPIAIGSVLAAGCLIGLAASTQVWQLYVYWGLGLGLAGALTSMQVASTTVANWFVLRRGTALALLTTIVGLAAPVYVPAASWLIVHTGWRQALLLLAAAFLLVPLPLSTMIRRRPEDIGLNPDGESYLVQGRHHQVEEGFSLSEALAHRSFWTLTLTTVLSATAFGAVTVHQVAHMIGRGMSPGFAASVVGTLGLLSIPGRFFFNAAGDRFGARRMVITVIAIQAFGIGILTLATSPAWLFAYAVTYGIASGSAFGIRAALMANMFGRRAFGAITAVYQLFIYIGTAAGPIAAGALFDRFRNYNIAFALATLLTALSIIGLVLIPRTRLERESGTRPGVRESATH